MDITITELEGPVTRVQLQGRLDSAGADAVGLRFTAGVVAEGRDAVVDLSGMSFIASLGIRLLISAARGLSAKGGRLVLFGPQPMVQQVFEDAALDQILTIVPTEAEALAALGR